MDSIEIIKQGAEGKLYIGAFEGNPCLVKERFVKKYRLTELDKTLTKCRMKAEQKTSKRCEDIGIIVPKIYNVDFTQRKIYMEYFDKSITAKQFIFENINNQESIQDLAERIGTIVAKMHTNHIIHGDLTTSNMLIEYNPKNYSLIMIDFGLSSYSATPEDKGVDLYVLERALLSTHSNLPEMFEKILQKYREIYTTSREVIVKFEEVRARGRKRTMVG